MYVWNGSTWEEVGPVVPQTPIAYQASAPVSPSTGDIWVDSDGDVGTFDRQLVRYRFVASGGETSLSGVDANGFTLAYVPGAEQVYLNGVLLVRTSDYTATNGTSITALSPALAANDVVEVFAYNSFNLANTYTKAEVDGSLDLKADVSANGLVHINTTSFSGVTSQSVNNVFSATYDKYMILIDIICNTAAGRPFFRLRASGTDATGTDYYNGSVGRTSAGTALDTQNSGGTYIDFNAFYSLKADGAPNYYKMILQDPFKTNRTMGSFESSIWTSTSINAFLTGSFMHGAATSYDGFTLQRIGGSETFTGSVTTFGFKE